MEALPALAMVKVVDKVVDTVVDAIAEQAKQMREDFKSAEAKQEAAREKSQLAAASGMEDIKEEFQKRPTDFGKASSSVDDQLGKIEGMKEEPGAELRQDTLTAAGLIRYASGGEAIQGIFVHPNKDELLKERKIAINVPDSLQFTGDKSSANTFNQLQSSQSVCDSFQSNIQKHGFNTSVSVGGGVYCGIYAGVGYGKGKQTSDTKSSREKQEKTYVASISYKRVPMEGVRLSEEDLSLSKHLLDKLKAIESAIIPLQYKTGKHFEDFFSEFGSHVNSGYIGLGGMIMSIAESTGFRRESEKTAEKIVSSTSHKHLNVFAIVGNIGTSHSTNKSTGSVKSASESSEHIDTRQNIVTIGGPQNTTDPGIWANGLVKNNKTWRVIETGNSVVPIWDILRKHGDKFDDVDKLIHAMTDEYTSITGFSVQLTSKPVVDVMRDQLSKMSEELATLKPATLMYSLRRIERIQVQHAISHDIWYRYMIKRDPAPKYYTQATECIKDFGTEKYAEKNACLTSLRAILYPVKHLIEPEFFPNIAEIMTQIGNPPEHQTSDTIQPFNCRTACELARNITNALEEDTSIQNLQAIIENTLTSWQSENFREMKPQHDGVVYEYLVCVAALHQHAFDPSTSMFHNILEKSDLKGMIDSLKCYSGKCAALAQISKKQAYILYVCLSSKWPSCDMLKYVVNIMKVYLPGGISRSLSWIIDDANSRNIVDNCTQIKRRLKEMYEGNKEDVLTYMNKMFDELNFVLSTTRISHDKEVTNIKSDPKIDKLLDILQLQKYFPSKMCIHDVITIEQKIAKIPKHAKSGATFTTTNVLIPDSPSHISEVPWYFLRTILAKNSSARETAHPILSPSEDNTADSNNDWDGWDDKLMETVTDADIHPLDLITIIFMCADDMLKQKLVNCMVCCQYAIPLIIPNGIECCSKSNKEQSCVLSWSLQSIVRDYFSGQECMEKYLVLEEMPLVSFMCIGEEDGWKEKLLNLMLSDNPDHTFWHQSLQGGQLTQQISNNIAELAWYLPGGTTTDKFPFPVAFTNLRGDARVRKSQFTLFLQKASVSCIFINEVNESTIAELRDLKFPENIILVFLYDAEKTMECKSTFQATLKSNPFLKKIRMIRGPKVGRQFDSIKSNLIAKIGDCLQLQTEQEKQHTSICSFAEEARKLGMAIDGQDYECQNGLRAANMILTAVDKAVQQDDQVKTSILPYHGDLSVRQKITERRKEKNKKAHFNDYRAKHKDATDGQYELHIETELWTIRKDILSKSTLSKPMRIFITTLLTMDQRGRQYFLQALSLGLNQRSLDSLQPKYKKYKLLRQNKDKQELSDIEKEMEIVAREISDGSIGIEHMFRELAELYDTIEVIVHQCKDSCQCKDSLRDIQENLATMMAQVILDGTALEIMDGDACQVPEKWIGHVFQKMTPMMDSSNKIFTVSAVGVQSCGKSTLLNTMFGLEFPVSSGRCTRGAFFQLIKLAPDMVEHLKCDYIGVVDTEGLQSRMITSGDNMRSQYDNELATLIIGMSDLVLIILKGEGREMQNIIPMAIHGFMHMNNASEVQACHFIHQNMGAVNAEQKIANAIDGFIKDLDKMVAVAIKETRRGGEHTKFSDILQYEDEDNTLVPGLWQGSPPMAPTNVQYAAVMGTLKTAILNHILRLIEKGKSSYALEDLSARITNLWNGITFEDFIFSFENTLAIQAYSTMRDTLTDWIYDTKYELRLMLKTALRKYKFDLSKRESEDSTVESGSEFREMAAMKIDENVRKKVENHLTTCQNKHLLKNKHHDFECDVNLFQTEFEKEVNEEFSRALNDWKLQEANQEIEKRGDKIIRETMLENIDIAKYENLSDEDIRKEFELLWRGATGNVNHLCKREETVNLQGLFAKALLAQLPNSDHAIYYKRRRESKGLTFKINRKDHLNLKKIMKRTGWSGMSKSDDKRMQGHANTIIKDGDYYITTETNKSQPFKDEFAEDLVRMTLKKIDEIDDQRVSITAEFKVDLVTHMMIKAVEKFEAMALKYNKQHHPAALLDLQKEHYYTVFRTEIGRTDIASLFCNSFLRETIIINVEASMGSIQLADILRSKNMGMFRNIQSLQYNIILELIDVDDFDRYIEYITDDTTRDWIETKSQKYFHGVEKGAKRPRLIEIALRNMTLIHYNIRTAFEDIRNLGCVTFADFLEQFVAKIENCEVDPNIPLAVDHRSLEIYKTVNMESEDEIKQFIDVALRVFGSKTFQNEIENEIINWDVSSVLDDTNPHDYVFTELTKCNKTCPFCKAPCDEHTCTTSGNCQVTLHRIGGLAGGRHRASKKLRTSFCPSTMGSGAKFKLPKDQRSKPGLLAKMNQWVKDYYYPYKKYQDIFPNWTIKPNSNPQEAIVWKWIFARFHDKLAEHYSCKKADIPAHWSDYSLTQVKEDLKKLYHR